MSIPTGHHLAAILPSKGARLEIAQRPTPIPGPEEVLIDVKSIALNPVDYFQRDQGLFISSYPAVLGSDVAGTIISVGSSVTAQDLKPGARVAAFATAYYANGNADYGGFQTRVIVASSNVVPIPDWLSFNEASILPMGVSTAWASLYTIGAALDTKYSPADKKGLLIWGGASSVGSSAVQVAKTMGFLVYTTASEKNHAYLKTLGASRTFDYKNEDVVSQIVKAAKEDGLAIQSGILAAFNPLAPCLEVLKELKGEGIALVASAAPIVGDPPKLDGVEAAFVTGPMDPEERKELSSFVFNTWLKENLENRTFVPSPKVQVVEGGLEAANEGLDTLKARVSAVKLVLEL